MIEGASMVKTQELKVSDVMTAVVHTCRAEDTLERAAQLLWEHDCGCLPVVDLEGVAQSMITDRDICMAAYTAGRPLAELRVADSMSSSLVTCAPGDGLATAAARMAEHQVRRLPVIDEAGRVQGLLSVNDTACAAAGDCTTALDDPAAEESLRILMAVCRHRGVQHSEAELEVAEVKISPANASRTSQTAGKAQQPRRTRHETA
jgi:CBS-domain-containing membrane protein